MLSYAMSTDGMASGALNSDLMDVEAVNVGAENSSATNVGAENNGAMNNDTTDRSSISVGAANSGAGNSDTKNGNPINLGVVNTGATNSDTMNGVSMNVVGINSGVMNNAVINDGIMNSTAMNNSAMDIDTMDNGVMANGTMNNGTLNSGITVSGSMNSGTMNSRMKASGVMSSGDMNDAETDSHLMNLDTAVVRSVNSENNSDAQLSSEAQPSDSIGRKRFSRWNNGNKSNRTTTVQMPPKIPHDNVQLDDRDPPVSSTAKLPPRPSHGTNNNSSELGSPSDTLPKLSPVSNSRPLSPSKQGPDVKTSKQTPAGPPRKRKSISSKDSSLPSKSPQTSEFEVSDKANEAVKSVELNVQKVRRRPPGGVASGSLWYDILFKAWPILKDDSPTEDYFSLEKILMTVEKNWTALRGKNPPKNHRWKGNILRTLQAQAERRPAAQTSDIVHRNTHMTDMYRLFDTFKPPDTSGRSGSLSANNVSSQNNENSGSTSDAETQKVLSTDATVQATVPRELILEATKPIQFSEVDKARLISFVGPSANNTVKGFKGFRTIRASAGVCEGDWFFEVQILTGASEGAVRLGWSLRRSDLETPVGFDGYGFAIRDISGEFVHRSLRTSYGHSFSKDDTIGCRIQLPSLTNKEKKIIEISEKRFLEYRFVKLLQGAAPPDSQLDIYSRAKVMFYKNGVCFGVPSFFTDKSGNGASKSTGNSDSVSQKSERNESIKLNGYQKRLEDAKKREMMAGTYYPAVSLYGNARVQANFGPEFRFGLPEGSKPMSAAVRPALKVRSNAKRLKLDKDGVSKETLKDEGDRDEDSDSGEEDRGIRDSMDDEEVEDSVAGPTSVQNDNDTETGPSKL